MFHKLTSKLAVRNVFKHVSKVNIGCSARRVRKAHKDAFRSWINSGVMWFKNLDTCFPGRGYEQNNYTTNMINTYIATKAQFSRTKFYYTFLMGNFVAIINERPPKCLFQALAQQVTYLCNKTLHVIWLYWTPSRDHAFHKFVEYTYIKTWKST